jgi:transglutaminase-like putative cysteine protease
LALTTLVRRWPTVAVLEAALLVLLVTLPFASHRNYRLSEPRMLSDWAFAHGYDPSLILCGIGMATLFALAVLRFRNLRGRQTAANLAALLLCLAAGFLLRDRLSPAAAGAADAGQQSAGSNSSDSSASNSNSSNSSSSNSSNPNSNNSSAGGSNQRPDPKPLAIVTLHDGVPPVELGFYFREAAFSKLDNNQLVQATDPAIDADVPTQFPSQPTKLIEGTAAPASDLTSTTVSLIGARKQPLCLVNAASLEPRPNADPKLFLRTYHVASRMSAPMNIETLKKKAGNTAWPAAVRAHYLACPTDPRYAELAAKILAESFDAEKIGIEECRKSPLLYAVVLRRWMEKHCIYSLKPGRAVNLDSSAAFLFGDHRGSCTHVAQSLVILLRTQGVPCRMAGGYMVPPQRRGQGSALLVTESDGHAWCEIYLDGAGWMTVDAALEQSEEPTPSEPDPAMQAFFGERNRLENPLRDQQSPHLLQTAYLLAAVCCCVAIFLLYGIKAWRRLAPHWAADRQMYRLCYRAALDGLAEVGLSRRFGETREEFAARLYDTVPEFVELSEAHVRQWLTVRPVFDRGGWIDLQTAAARRLAAAVSRPRRMLGLLNPVSWLWAR